MLYNLFLNSTARHVLQLLPLALAAGLLVWVSRRKMGRAQEPKREWLLFFFTCYITGLLCMVLAPNGLWQSIWYRILTGQPGGQIGPLFSGTFCLEPRLIEFLTGQRTAGIWTITMYIGNIGLLIPMGFFLPPVFPKRKLWQCLLMGLGLIFAIELLQPIVGRSFDIDDIICNTLGLLLGLLIPAALRRRKRT